MTLNDIELQKSWVLVIFSWFALRRTFQEWIAPKWLRIDRDNLRMKFSPQNVDFTSASPDHLNSRTSEHAGVRGVLP